MNEMIQAALRGQHVDTVISFERRRSTRTRGASKLRRGCVSNPQ